MIDNEIVKQFFSQISRAKRILIARPPGASVDTAGAAGALALFLRRLDKEADISAGENDESNFSFLPKLARPRAALSAGQSLAVLVDTSKKALEEISYVQEAGRTKIFLKGAAGGFTPQEIGFETVKSAPYDLAVIIGAQSLEDLGAGFFADPDQLYEMPKANIDCHPGNKHFGGVNLVDINASSVSEIAAGVLEEFETDLVDADIATCLLSGIMARTGSFQHPQVTPKTFLRASRLLEKGARQPEIVRALFKSRSLPQLKLWGRALARLKAEEEASLSVLNQSDFAKSAADAGHLELILKDLVEHLAPKMLIGVLAEVGPGSRLFLAARRGFDLNPVLAVTGPGQKLPGLISGPYEIWRFDLPEMALPEAEDGLWKALLDKIRK